MSPPGLRRRGQRLDQRVLRIGQVTWVRRPCHIPSIGQSGASHTISKRTNTVWQLDLLQLRVLWFRFTIAVLMDGFSRRILELKVSRGVPTSRQMTKLVRRAAITHGLPRFIITDHGCQFRAQFRKAMKTLGVIPVRGRVRSLLFNGKVGRFFRTLCQLSLIHI